LELIKREHEISPGEVKFLCMPNAYLFQTNKRPEPIIHRVIETKQSPGETSFKTKGDNNCGSADFEQNIPDNTVIGKTLFKVPLLGWIKIGFVVHGGQNSAR